MGVCTVGIESVSDEQLNNMYGMTATVDENGVITFEDGTQYDLNQPIEKDGI